MLINLILIYKIYLYFIFTYFKNIKIIYNFFFKTYKLLSKKDILITFIKINFNILIKMYNVFKNDIIYFFNVILNFSKKYN